MLALWAKIKEKYRYFQPRSRFRVLKPTMFDTPGFSTLKGKAGEIKGIAAPLLSIWTDGMTEGIPLHNNVRDLLQASVDMDQILDDHPHDHRLPGDVSDKFVLAAVKYCQLCNALYRHGDEDLFNVTFKHHALLHIALNSRWTNPRKTACWMGEDFMRVSKRLMQPCLFGHNLEATSAKITKKFLRAMDFTFRNA